MKVICTFWQGELKAGRNQLDFKKLQSDRGFLVYVTQAYPGMKPYLKGLHLSLEMWRGGRDAEGWKVNPGKVGETETRPDKEWGGMEAIKMGLLSQGDTKEHPAGDLQGPPSGQTRAAPRFERDLEALLHLRGDS